MLLTIHIEDLQYGSDYFMTGFAERSSAKPVINRIFAVPDHL